MKVRVKARVRVRVKVRAKARVKIGFGVVRPSLKSSVLGFTVWTSRRESNRFDWSK